MKKGYKFTKPMTDAHKKHISEGQIKSFTEERKKLQSKIMKNFWNEYKRENDSLSDMTGKELFE